MPIRFRKPPLVELIAELHWGNPVTPTMMAPGTFSAIGTVSTRAEEFFVRFGDRVAGDGYSRAERIVPAGFPMFPFQAACRYRRATPHDGTALYQVGVGVFSANITPPYSSWEEFRPVVERGISILLDTRDASEREMPFATIALRYIDAFKPDLTGGRPVTRFLTDILDFRIGLPRAIQDEIANEVAVKPVLQLTMPLKSGQQMAINLGEGLASNEPSFIMDTTVTSNGPIDPVRERAMAALDEAHAVIRRTFVTMTERI